MREFVDHYINRSVPETEHKKSNILGIIIPVEA